MLITLIGNYLDIGKRSENNSLQHKITPSNTNIASFFYRPRSLQCIDIYSHCIHKVCTRKMQCDYIFTIAPVSTLSLDDVIDWGNLYMLRKPQTGYH